MASEARTCPGRGAAFFTMHRRAGTHRHAAWSMDPGSATHHAARAARCVASGARIAHRSSSADCHIHQTRLRIPAARIAPELCRNLSPRNRGRGATPRGERGMPGARCTRSRAWCVESTRVSHHGRTGITRHSRTRMVLTVSFALSPVTGLVCHRHQQKCLPLT
jgi:hypothetical protein